MGGTHLSRGQECNSDPVSLSLFPVFVSNRKQFPEETPDPPSIGVFVGTRQEKKIMTWYLVCKENFKELLTLEFMPWRSCSHTEVKLHMCAHSKEKSNPHQTSKDHF